MADKPWLEVGVGVEAGAATLPPTPTAKVGLGVFLVVVGSLFALHQRLFHAHGHGGLARAADADGLLWFSTGLLVLASVALHMAQVDRRRANQNGHVAPAPQRCVLARLPHNGQLLAWRELSPTAISALPIPASAFFYLITAVHGLHMLGGLVALCRTTASGPALRRPAPQAIGELTLSVELCALYWHFLLLIWLILFSLLMRWAR
jgi:cytochrome c oxidase subunit 3